MKFPQINVKYLQIIMKIEKNGISPILSYDGLGVEVKSLNRPWREYIRSPRREEQEGELFKSKLST